MWRIVLAFVLFGCVQEVHSESSPSERPKSLEECYLTVVSEQRTADAAFVGRELCDAVFGPKRRSLFVHDKETGGCFEWWLDKRGHYETHDVYCAFENAGNARWTLACQYKDRPSRMTLVELRQEGDRYVRVDKLTGVDPGEIFATMAACVRQKAGK